MTETAVSKPKRMTTADYKAIAAQLLDDIGRLEKEMDEDRSEGERLKAETQAIKAHAAETITQVQEQIDRLSKAA